MNSDNELDELLRLVDEPLPLRGEREGDLFAELLGELEKGPLVTSDVPQAEGTGFVVDRPLDDGAVTVVPIDLEPVSLGGRSRRSLAGAALALAAAIAVVAGFAFLVADDESQIDITDDQTPTTVVTTTLPPPRTVEVVCAEFADSAPDRLDLRQRVNSRVVAPEELQEVIDGLDSAIGELGRRPDVSADALESLRFARGSLVLARENVEAGGDGELAFGVAEDRLDVLRREDPRFEDCWRF